MTSGPDPAEETVAIFDADGTAVGTAPRSRVYAEGLWHASAAVLVRSSTQKIYVHRRTDSKAVFAGHHDALAGGVLDPGESPLECAQRELREELGVDGVDLTPIARVSWDSSWAGRPLRCHLYAYETRWDGPIVHQPSEIAAGWWWTEDELRAHLDDPTWLFVPDSRALLAEYL